MRDGTRTGRHGRAGGSSRWRAFLAAVILMLSTAAMALAFSSQRDVGVRALGGMAVWQPPLGIPAPPFGRTETAPEPPDPWTTGTPGFYYVDPTHSSAGDLGNPFGTPAKPRASIPTLLPAGSVVELHGLYDRPQSSPNAIVAQGTASNPVFIRGVSETDRPVIRRDWEIQGTYLVLENLEFGPQGQTVTGTLVVRAPSSHVAIRHSEFRGTRSGGGLGIVNWSTANARTNNVLVYRSSFHDNGDVNATFDQDAHGIAIGDRVDHVWVLENEMYRNSGDGIQINAGTNLEETTHHIYVGRNVSHDNKQTGFWVKQATDVIFSQNLAYSHRPGNSSVGQCMGGQYGPDRVWWIFNHVHDCEYGIALMSDLDDGRRETHDYLIGNVIHNIHRTTITNDATDAWGSSAIMLAGGYERHAINNTIYDVDSGINSPSPFGSLDIVNNIIVNVTPPAGAHVNVEFLSLASRTNIRHVLFFPEPRVNWVRQPTIRLTSAQLSAIDGVAAPPQFVDPAADDFHLGRTSPAGTGGELHRVYATYRQLYGIDITRDFDGMARPNMSLGAYEAWR
jgi:hypothetical protein